MLNKDLQNFQGLSQLHNGKRGIMIIKQVSIIYNAIPYKSHIIVDFDQPYSMINIIPFKKGTRKLMFMFNIDPWFIHDFQSSRLWNAKCYCFVFL